MTRMVIQGSFCFTPLAALPGPKRICNLLARWPHPAGGFVAFTLTIEDLPLDGWRLG